METNRPATAFEPKYRAHPALIGAATAIGAFMLGLALLPLPSPYVAAVDGSVAGEMAAPAAADNRPLASHREFPLAPATGVFEDGPLDVHYDVWG